MDPHERPGRGFSTRAIRAVSGAPRLRQTSTSVPIFQTATFSAEDAADLAEVLSGKGFAYSRIDNPTAAAMGDAVAELEGAQAGLAFGSGMGAVHAALAAVLQAGDRIVASPAVYGSTRSLLDRVFGRFGVAVDLVDATDLDAVEAALRAAPTRVLYAETISNPTIAVADIAALAERAHRAGTLAVVDNTFASPYVCRPLELGADLVIESATKWLGGHSDVTAGAVAGPEHLIRDVRAVRTDTGGIVEPFSAFLVLRGIATLAARMDRQASTALALATALEASPVVRRVLYPSLASHPQAAVARRQLRNGGGMLAADLGSREAAIRFIDALTIPERTASLGSVHTMATHPPSTSHRQFTEAQLAEAGIPPGLVRVSVGLEDADDLLADVAAALAVSPTAAPV